MLSPLTFLRDLRQIKGALWTALIFFAGGIAAGWFGTGGLESLLNSQMEGLGRTAQNLRESSSPQMSFFIFIFLNNSIKSVVILYLGALFGILPALFLVINGGVIGYLVHRASLQGADLFDLIVKGLLPHGVIEIPALLIACAYGIHFGRRVFDSLGRRQNREAAGWSVFMRQTLTASVWIILLLLIAAVIESTLTFALLS
ncbi:stage II sporulation protein M [Paenibacillus spiritus]|uniref:Stage II sporulation protein M n=1 Tax=Paenibacillus spiritus TaxID=2496557 RepID=A0A5J5FTI5_9BACL|nr:stage II sporulation protein M [Paenibacillus spiritus]KAA8995923.1 stage II sporulation protein M [Paenibacillus spiritus]